MKYLALLAALSASSLVYAQADCDQGNLQARQNQGGLRPS
jgi:hypothetical protein